MIPNPNPRDSFTSAAYARTAPFSRIIDIMSMEGLRPGVTIPEAGRLGTLTFDPPAQTEMERELPYAFHEMLERAPQLVIHPVQVSLMGITRTVYVVAAQHEVTEKAAAFSHWANHHQPIVNSADLMKRYQFWDEFLGENSPRVLGWWALGYQVAWALTAEAAQRLIDEAFRPVVRQSDRELMESVHARLQMFGGLQQPAGTVLRSIPGATVHFIEMVGTVIPTVFTSEEPPRPVGSIGPDGQIFFVSPNRT